MSVHTDELTYFYRLKLMVTGRRGGPGDDAHVLVVVELNRGLDLALILHRPLAVQDVLDQEARQEVVMKSHSAQVR